MREIDRILDLDEVLYDSGVSPGWRWQRHGAAPSLLPDQISFLSACQHAAAQPLTDDGFPGVLGFMSCGSGKTLALQLAPHLFGVPRKKCLLVTQSSLMDQLDRDVETWGQHYRLADPPRISYARLSRPESDGLLEQLRPDLILFDEGRNIGEGCRKVRLWKYVAANRHVRLVVADGALWGKSVIQVADIAALVLRNWSPFPFGNSILEHWASVLDPGGEFDAFVDYGALKPLVDSLGTDCGDMRDSARAAVAHRLRTAPGVVVTTGINSYPCQLRIDELAPVQTPALDHLEKAWELPDGTQLVDMLEYHRHVQTLRLGFFYRYVPETVDEEWMQLRKWWNAILRDHVEYGHFETPYFVTQAAEDGRLQPRAQTAYLRWCDVRARVDPPERETIWVGTGAQKLGALVEKWRKDNPYGCVWYHSKAVEGWADERGYKVFPAGEPPPRVAEKGVVLSLAHRTGWNAESGSTSFSSALVLQPPTSAREVEQLLARHHRKGQSADEVVYTFVTTPRQRKVLEARAQAVHDMTTAPQRYLVADKC